MKKIDLKKPSDFDSHKRWQEARQKAKRIEKNIRDKKEKLKKAQNTLPDLEKQSARLYQKDEINLDEMKHIDDKIEQCKQDIVSCKEEWQKLKETLEDQQLQEAKTKQEFLIEASIHAKEILNEFMPILHKAKEYKDHVSMYTKITELGLPNIDNTCLYFWTKKPEEKFLKGFRQRHEEITTGDFKTRELTKLKNQQS